MCKFCKKLREINDLREKNLQDIINKWKRRDYRARQLLHLAYILLSINGDEYFLKSYCLKDIHEFLKKDWIGK